MNVGSREVFEQDTKPYLRKVAYLESNGVENLHGQYIDTGFIFTTKSACKIEMMWMSEPPIAAYQIGFIQKTDTGNFRVIFARQLAGGKRNLLFSSDNYFGDNNPITEKVVYYVDYKNMIKQVNDAQAAITTQPIGTFTKSFYLFARNAGGYVDNHFANCRIYNAKFYDNGMLKLDLIPVLDISGRPAMFDEVSNTLFYNQGTGEFTYGELENQ